MEPHIFKNSFKKCGFKFEEDVVADEEIDTADGDARVCFQEMLDCGLVDEGATVDDFMDEPLMDEPMPTSPEEEDEEEEELVDGVPWGFGDKELEAEPTLGSQMTVMDCLVGITRLEEFAANRDDDEMERLILPLRKYCERKRQLSQKQTVIHEFFQPQQKHA